MDTKIFKNNFSTLKAIIFYMDGVIVDTEFLEYGLQTQFIENIKENDRP